MVKRAGWPGATLVGLILLVTAGVCAPLRANVAVTGSALRMPPSAVTLPAGMVLTQLPLSLPSLTTSNNRSHEPLGGSVTPVRDTEVAPAVPASTGLPPQVVRRLVGSASFNLAEVSGSMTATPVRAAAASSLVKRIRTCDLPSGVISAGSKDFAAFSAPV